MRESRAQRRRDAAAQHGPEHYLPPLQLLKEFPRRCWALIALTVLLDVAAIIHGTDGATALGDVALAVLTATIAWGFLFAFFSSKRTGIMESNIGTLRRSKEPIEFWVHLVFFFLVYLLMSVSPLLIALGVIDATAWSTGNP